MAFATLQSLSSPRNNQEAAQAASNFIYAD